MAASASGRRTRRKITPTPADSAARHCDGLLASPEVLPSVAGGSALNVCGDKTSAVTHRLVFDCRPEQTPSQITRSTACKLCTFDYAISAVGISG